MLLATRLLLGKNPITLIGTAVKQASVGGATTLDIDTPANATAGDLLIVFMGTATGSSQTWSGDTNWTELFDSGAGGPNIRAAWIVYNGTPATYHFTYSGTGKPASGVIAAYRNARIDTNSAIVTSSPVASINLVGSNSLVLLVSASVDKGITLTATGFSSVFIDNDSTNPSIAMLSKTYNVGATGTMAFSGNTNEAAAIGLRNI